MTRRIAILIVTLSLIAALTGGCVFCTPLTSRSGFRRMTLQTVEPAKGFWTVDRVLLIGIDGILTDGPDTGGMLSSPSTIIPLKDALKQAEKDDSIRAVVVRVNSPGGGVTASDVIYEELRRFKKKTGKKILFIMMDIAASGGYYIAMAGDRVMAHPTSVTGSIGVIAKFPAIEGLGSKIGLDMRVIKSGAHKDIGSMWRRFSNEERAILQKTIDEMYERFVKVVDEGRPKLTTDEVRRLADGRIYTAEQAKAAGLIDEIGYIPDAFEAAKKLAGISDAALVTYREPYDYAGHYYAESGASPSARQGSQINLLNLDLGQSLAGGLSPFHYLWVP